VTQATDDKKRGRRRFVYAFIDPATNTPRYVGCTCDLASRLKCHIQAGPVSPWLRRLRANGMLPTLVVLAVCPDAASGYAAEQEWIAKFVHEGHDLINCNKRPDGFKVVLTEPPKRPRSPLSAEQLAVREKRLAKWRAKHLPEPTRS
jgi:hypothetical protein